MGVYVDVGNSEFEGYVKDELFVDKSGLICLTNASVGVSGKKRIVVSRPRRFGKTMAISMLAAYYSCGCDSRELFRGLAIEKDPSFEKHLNKHNVISLDVQGLFHNAKRRNRQDDFPCYISEVVNAELGKLYPDEVRGNEGYLEESLPAIHSVHHTSFIFLLDEWDVIYRDQKFNEKLKRDYTEFLKGLFKNSAVSSCIDLVYMTGILPIPKKETQSGLNNFREYTMLRPLTFAEHIGFTDWYDGYQFETVKAVYCPASVVQALGEHEVGSYWGKTGSAAELLELMNCTEENFQETVKKLLAGVPVPLSVDSEGIDLSDVGTLDTALTALVHLGYLAYQEDGNVRIPNLEVAAEFVKTLSRAKNNPAYKLMAQSKDLLDKTLCGDEKAVARILEANHDMYSSVFTYNQENDLVCVIIASYSGFVERDYSFMRELPTGKGFADIVFFPITPGKTPVIIELKWDKSADTAIQQIKERRYTGRVQGFPSVVLVGISYEKDPEKPGYKEHNCVIERIDNL